MSIIHDYLYDLWNEEGIVPELSTIEEALETKISHDEAVDIPLVVQDFMRTIIKEEGVILYETTEKPKKRTESTRIRIDSHERKNCNVSRVYP